MEAAVVVDAVRRRVGRYGGALKDVRPDDLAALVIRTLVERNALDPALVEDVILGCANGAGEDNRNVARMAVLLAGLPVTVGGLTVNRLCGPGLDAINRCAQSIQTGAGEVFIGGGTESMTRAAFREGGTVTAGNSSGINDGAAAVLIMSETKAREIGLTPLARVVATAVAGVDPACMGLGPIPATRKALQRAGLDAHDVDVIELNEAFAAQSLACIRELALDPARVNPNGGAIALGHPLGCSGARLATTLVYEMARRGHRYGLATMCIGVGQGIATIFERVA